MIDLKTFFEKSEGKWFTQRTQYDLGDKNVENAQGELTVELLSKDDPLITQLHQQDSQLSSYLGEANLSDSVGAKISWDAKGNQGTNIIILIPEEEEHSKGRLIQKSLNSQQAIKQGEFILGEDEALTLSTAATSNHPIKERLWFAHPNLRLRTVWQESNKGNQGWVIFYSEIRRMTS